LKYKEKGLIISTAHAAVVKNAPVRYYPRRMKEMIRNLNENILDTRDMIFKRKETVSLLTKLTRREIKGISIYLCGAENNERNVIRGSELKYNRYE